MGYISHQLIGCKYVFIYLRPRPEVCLQKGFSFYAQQIIIVFDYEIRDKICFRYIRYPVCLF
jgi:hypothetical protein